MKNKLTSMNKVEDIKVLKKTKTKKPKKEKKYRTDKESEKGKVEQAITKDLVKVINSDDVTNGIQAKKEKAKQHKQNVIPLIEDKTAANNETATKLNDSDLSAMGKKKAKKLAQKLRKHQKKSLGQEIKNDEKTLKAKLPHKEVEKNKHNKKSAEELVAKSELNGEHGTVTTKNEKKQLKAEKKTKKLKELQGEKAERVKTSGEEVATIFVGNLPINTKRVQLIRLFKDFGPLNAVRLRTGSGKTIFKHKDRLNAGTLNAYIVLKDAEAANRAIALNGIEFKSNHLRITRADKNAHNSSDSDSNKRTIFVGNLKYSATEENLREIFSSCGEIDYVRCLRAGEKGCNGVAYVCFKAPEAVGLALELKETMLDERPIHVERYSPKKLGAKQSRDAAAQASQKPLLGAKKRLNIKDKKQTKLSKNNDGGENKKKGEFRGVKVDGIKKKEKKKKPSSHMQQLAKKIAPKTA